MSNLDKMWEDVEYELQGADSIAWDGCHKIYLQMDSRQTAKMFEYGYDPLIMASDSTVPEMLTTLKEWYNDSCGLRFIQSVRTVEDDPNKGYTNLIPQGAEEDDYCDHEYDSYCDKCGLAS
jgi:hypothetical protein